MPDLAWIIIGGLLMSAVAMIGGFTAILNSARLEAMLLPLVALAGGTLLGGAFFHMIPEGLKTLDATSAGVWLVCGFAAFLALEQFLHWHHSHRTTIDLPKPFTYLILIGDAAHNFLGGVAISSTFLISPHAGVVAWLAAVAHEVPQELGDFGVLVHGGWPRRRALLLNLLSALTFPVGALLAYFASLHVDIAGLVLLGAGNFIYIAASDLVPEIKVNTNLNSALLNFSLFAVGLALMFALTRITQ